MYIRKLELIKSGTAQSGLYVGLGLFFFKEKMVGSAAKTETVGRP